MTRWRHTKDLDQNADLQEEHKSVQNVYRAVMSYLERSAIPWQSVEAHLNFSEPQPLYNEIIVDGIIVYADRELLDCCAEVNIQNSRYTFSDKAIDSIEISVKHSEKIGSFGYCVSYITGSTMDF